MKFAWLFIFTLSLPAWAAPLRVAVVGAGPAGLTAARTLSELGHQVVVFEKENRVGGKVFSIPVFPDKSLEFGAVLVTEDDYPITLGYAEEFDIPIVPVPTGFTILDESANRVAMHDFLRSRYTPSEIAAAEANYAAVLRQFADFIDAPGMTSLPDGLSMPFADFAEQHGITVVEDWMRSFLTGFGYSYSESVPAAYYVKFLPFLVNIGPTGLEGPAGRIFPGGFQSVFDALAATLDVRLGAEVTHIQRPPDWCAPCPVRLTVNRREQHVFNAVVIATPLNVVPRFLDVTPFEKWLFTRMQSERYFVTLFAGLGLPIETLFVQKNAFPSRINHATALATPYDFGFLSIGNAYQVVDREQSAAQLQVTLAEDMWQAGGWYLFGLYQQEWENYFPRVGPLFLELGFYDVIDGMQGRQSTYYVGSSLTFETVEHAARQARNLILEHFRN